MYSLIFTTLGLNLQRYEELLVKRDYVIERDNNNYYFNKDHYLTSDEVLIVIGSPDIDGINFNSGNGESYNDGSGHGSGTYYFYGNGYDMGNGKGCGEGDGFWNGDGAGESDEYLGDGWGNGNQDDVILIGEDGDGSGSCYDIITQGIII